MKSTKLIITLVIISGLAVLLYQFVRLNYWTEPAIGIRGEPTTVDELPLEQAELNNDFTKISFQFDDHQLTSFQKIYPQYDLSSPMMILGQVVEIDADAQRVKLSTEMGDGWIRISPEWHGNTLTWSDEVDDYQEQSVINIPRGQWPQMQEYLLNSSKVMFLCTEPSCPETIGGHVYLD